MSVALALIAAAILGGLSPVLGFAAASFAIFAAVGIATATGR
jgi:hypothetical protein